MDASSDTGHGGPPICTEGPIVFHEAIARLLEAGHSRRALATHARCDESTVTKWLGGQDPKLSAVCSLLDGLRADGRDADADLVAAVIDRRRGRGAGAALDLDGDGRRTPADAIAGCVQLVVSAADAMKETELAFRDGRITEREVAGLLHTFAIVREKIDRTQTVVQAAYDTSRTRPARRVAHLNGTARHG